MLLVALLNLMPSAVPAQALTVLHTFSIPANGTNQDGANPIAGLALMGNVLYGTAANGGRFGAGVEFYLNADGTGFSLLHSFTNQPDAGNPLGDLVGSDSKFYGSTFGGGTTGTGAVFGGQTNGNSSLIHSFADVDPNAATNVDGASPSAALTLSAGTLYGTGAAGGFFGNGVVFSVGTNGLKFSVIHHFTTLNPGTGTNADGAMPWGGLVLSGDALYGTTSAGGAGGSGTIFSINTNGNNFTTLYNFTTMDPATGTNTDGASPCGGLVLSNGTLYGTTTAGGYGNGGTIFSIGTNGTGFVVLHHFTGFVAPAGTNFDGAKPEATLLLSGNSLYGTTPAGGSGASGTVFSINNRGNNFTTLYNFTAVNPVTGTNVDGAYPVADVLLSGNSLCGTAYGGGAGAAGTVFSLSIPPSPAVIMNIVQNADGSLTLFFLGSANSTNIIQATANLAPPVAWQNISTNVADGTGAWQFTDTSQFSAQFYRSYSK